MTDDVALPVTTSTQWHRVDGCWLRVLRFHLGPPGVAPQQGTALVFPGLALPRYVLPLARLQAARGIETLVLDPLAWRGRDRRATPTVPALARVAARWMSARRVSTAEPHGPVVAVGHSTGANVALEAVLAVQDSLSGLGLVMAGPTFQPDQRPLRGLLPAALTAYSRDTPKELVVVRDVVKVRTDLVRIVQSARRHRVEERVAGLRVPLTVTAGEADSFASPAWLDALAARAGSTGRAVVLPGSHNNLFTHPEAFASVVAQALAGSGEDTRATGP